MTKEEFIKLANKFEEGRCSEKEREILFHFCERVQEKNMLESLGYSEEEKLRIRLLQRINSSIVESSKTHWFKRARPFFGYAAAAAVIGILLALFFKQSEQEIFQDSIDSEIILTLADGTTKRINALEGALAEIHIESYITQIGNKLVYENNSSGRELAYHTIEIPFGETFELQLSDGTKVNLNAGSSLKYPVQFSNEGARQVYLKGEAYFQVEHDSSKTFIVNTNSIDVRVLGTTFNVSAYEDESSTKVVLVEGSVKLKEDEKIQNKLEPVLLQPGFMASYNPTNPKFHISNVETEVYTAWIEGRYIFREMPLDMIFQKLARAYNVEFENRNPQTETDYFNSTIDIKQQPLSEVLELFSELYSFDYEIKDKKITVTF
ncbi:MAG: hypothetical protein CML05_09195 [Pseudozobellia sp.]|nr:hypothetical protein [Pseudozobellia sp.]|tara:strand:+ start:1491 stop:2624 length:1134 start_codon:yes stop_codon:yes gene_type:complete